MLFEYSRCISGRQTFEICIVHWKTSISAIYQKETPSCKGSVLGSENFRPAILKRTWIRASSSFNDYALPFQIV